MLFDITIIGFGVIGVETLYGIQKILLKKKSKNKIKIAIVEKNLKNIPGGVAYSQENSKFGYFNNPLRLSHPDFIEWFKINDNKNRLINFSENNLKYKLTTWLNNNKEILNKKFVDYKEIYLPRLIYSFYLRDKIIKFLNLKKRINISLKFYNGEVHDLNNLRHYNIFPKYKFNEFSINSKNEKLLLKKHKSKSSNIIKSKKIVIGTGIVPPKKIKEIKTYKNSNYIWDFYSTGGTNNLIKKINKIYKIKKDINIIFIGNKAGLLETMQEIEKLITKNEINIKITCISKNTQTLQKAERSKKFDDFKFKHLNNKNIHKIKKAEHVLKLLKSEFKNAKLDGFNKYDVWTNVLKNKIISICYNQLNEKEKKIYNLLIFPLIRNMTRYTYPDTVSAKNRLERKNKIKFIKDRVVKIIKNKDKLILKTKNKKSINGDIAINVSGPVSIEDNKNEIQFISSLKKITKKFNGRGFTPNKNFMLEKDLYIPGTLSNNFNPGRETIIKAITKNSHKVAKNIFI
tara:strand:+ start:13172 stop:14716 length:1545 start_codon:yes stop_codon:yes gene_type:complete